MIGAGILTLGLPAGRQARKAVLFCTELDEHKKVPTDTA